MEDLKGTCWWCKEEQTFLHKKMVDKNGHWNMHHVCKKCNSTQSEVRLKKGKDLQVRKCML